MFNPDRNAVGQAVIFDVAGRSCALDLHTVANVLRYLSATTIPGAPRGVHGVISFEDRPTLVADLAAIFGFGRTTPTSRTCILLIGVLGQSAAFGVLADSVLGVVDAKDRVPVNVSLCKIPSEFARLMVRSEKGDVPLLATAAVYQRLIGETTVDEEAASCQ